MEEGSEKVVRERKLECPALAGPRKIRMNAHAPVYFQRLQSQAKVVDPASAGLDTPKQQHKNLLFQSSL